MTNEVIAGTLPADLSIEALLGEGKRLRAFKGSYRGRPVAVKLYRNEYIAKYRRKYRVSIAQFEYDRNLSLYPRDSLRKSRGEPMAVLKPEEGYAEGFIQGLA